MTNHPKPNKDRELLRECLQVLDAMATLEASRNMMRLLGVGWGPSLGTRTTLAAHMADKLRAHLGDGFDETRQQLEELGKASGGSHRQHIGD